MRILFLHQPFPMGNYKLIPYIAEYYTRHGHVVYTLQQLNGAVATDEYIQTIQNAKFDVIYYEMLDNETFKVVSQLTDSKRILCYASKGIFDNFEDILQYHKTYYDVVYTNSKQMHQQFLNHNIESEFFEYYPAPIELSDAVPSKIYSYNCVYLGGGFQRLTKPEYSREQELIYNNTDITIFGNGWPATSNYKGVLPANDIGKLYSSCRSAIATIEPSQRSMGMINNRYSEIFKVGNKLLSIDYPEIDFYGGEEFITFVNSRDDIKTAITDIDPKTKQRQLEFILDKEQKFFDTLTNLL